MRRRHFTNVVKCSWNNYLLPLKYNHNSAHFIRWRMSYWVKMEKSIIKHCTAVCCCQRKWIPTALHLHNTICRWCSCICRSYDVMKSSTLFAYWRPQQTDVQSNFFCNQTSISLKYNNNNKTHKIAIRSKQTILLLTDKHNYNYFGNQQNFQKRLFRNSSYGTSEIENTADFLSISSLQAVFISQSQNGFSIQQQCKKSVWWIQTTFGRSSCRKCE